jgi:hypothetical protein
MKSKKIQRKIRIEKMQKAFQKEFEKGDYLAFLLDEFIQYLKEQQVDNKLDVDEILTDWRKDTDEYLPFNSYSFRRLCWLFANAFAWCLKDTKFNDEDLENFEDFSIDIVQGNWHWFNDDDEIIEEEV